MSTYVPTVASIILFFFNDPATTEIYTLSLHDALPILPQTANVAQIERTLMALFPRESWCQMSHAFIRSEEHTSELQSQFHLVCRLLLEKKKKKIMVSC